MNDKTQPSFYKNVYFLLRGSVLFQIITIVSLALITRIYEPEVIGKYAVFFSITTIFGTIGTGRLELALMIPKTNIESNNIFLTGKRLSLYISTVIMLIVLLNMQFNVLESLNSKVYLLFPIATFFLSNTLLQAQKLNRSNKFKEVGIGKFLFGLTIAFIQLFFSYFYATETTLVLGFLIGLLVLMLYYKYHIVLDNNLTHKKFLITLRQNKLFPLINNLGSFFNLLANQGPIILVELFFGATLTAYLSVVQKSLNAPSSLLSRAFSDVFFKKVTDKKTTQSELKRFVKLNLKYFLLLSVLAFIVIFFFGEEVYTLVFGIKFIESSKIARIMISFFLMRFIVTGLNSIIIARKWLKLDLTFNILLFLSQITPIIIGFYFNLEFYSIITLMTIFGALSYLYLGFLVYLGINKKQES
ncbi:MAG: hypothetical protein COA67_03655 [Lutibacter sp.]|nr:MAG: hypothetical protein COA67_03655 [Lutibacter sp.]